MGVMIRVIFCDYATPPISCKVSKTGWLMALYRVKYSIEVGCG